ncbi:MULTISPECIES: O-antigen ligase [Halomonadaceae]|uniref:O-antigen ligase family protein n=1 Tax=Halomonadaceae TaxID=28256 RepID=UPI00200F997F|nr:MULTISPECIES: O-antigen ligase family protein [Halomonas]
MLALWPWWAALLLLWLRSFAPSVRLLWWGVCCGALGAGGIAIFERMVLGQSRASNGMNAIPFGNLALLLGTLSLLATLWCLRRGRPQRWWLVAAASLAALLGLSGSLLSGTRGGWIALPLLLLLVYRAALGIMPARRLNLLSCGVMFTVLLFSLLPQSGVVERVTLVASEAQRYWQQDRPGNSLGIRVELWRAGGLLLIERPLLGWGEGGVEAQRDVLIAQGRIYDRVVIHDQLHNDIIDTAARRGLIGLATLLVLYGVPLWLFWSRLRRTEACAGFQLLAVAGMMVPIAFFAFGMTQSMLRDARGLSGYLGLCIACWVALRAYEKPR